MEKELLDLYLDGMELDLLSAHLNLEIRAVVMRLSELFFGLEKPRQDPTATRFGKTWNWGESSRLWRMYAVGIGIPTIAKKLERDELGVCFRILSEQHVIVPKAVVKKYKLDQDNFATESDSEYTVKTCSNCLDVAIYCKCSF